MNYTRVTVADFRSNMSDYMDMVRYGSKVVVIEKWGKVPLKLELMEEQVSQKDKLEARRKALKETAGLWVDRDDMKDSVKWVQELRKKEDNRYGRLHR